MTKLLDARAIGDRWLTDAELADLTQRQRVSAQRKVLESLGIPYRQPLFRAAGDPQHFQYRRQAHPQRPQLPRRRPGPAPMPDAAPSLDGRISAVAVGWRRAHAPAMSG